MQKSCIVWAAISLYGAARQYFLTDGLPTYERVFMMNDSFSYDSTSLLRKSSICLMTLSTDFSSRKNV